MQIHICEWVAVTHRYCGLMDIPILGTGLCPLHTEDSSYTRAKYLTAGTTKSQWCRHLEVWKNFSYLLTELLSPFFSYSFFFHKFYKLLPCPKGDPENPPLRIKRKNVKY